MDNQVATHQIDCDKCCGSGKIFQCDVHSLIRQWRTALGMPRKTLAAFAKIPYTSYCKFEKGRLIFSEGRVRLLVSMLQFIEQERQE